MHRFEASDLKRFLVAIDKHIDQPYELRLIGGSAAALGYGVQTVTKDIDALPGKLTLIASAIEKAREETGLSIPIEEVGVYNAPYNFEDRARTVPIDGLKHLVVKVPEKHDLVLMKMTRGQDPDLEVAEKIFRLQGLDKDTLIDRYLDEMDAAIGHRPMLDLNCRALISRLFGDAAEREAEERIKARRSRGKRE
jgi:hypothetical protein